MSFYIYLIITKRLNRYITYVGYTTNKLKKNYKLKKYLKIKYLQKNENSNFTTI